jgi:hypothetical protein
MEPWLIGAAVALALAYIGWEFRWYWSTLLRSWRADAEAATEEPTRELAGHPRPR